MGVEPFMRRIGDVVALCVSYADIVRHSHDLVQLASFCEREYVSNLTQQEMTQRLQYRLIRAAMSRLDPSIACQLTFLPGKSVATLIRSNSENRRPRKFDKLDTNATSVDDLLL